MRDARRDAAAVLVEVRRRLQTAIGCGTGLATASIGLSGVVLFVAGRVVGDGALGRVALGILMAPVAAFVLTRLVWRCPACDGPLRTEGPLLPSRWNVCPWCGARLAVEPDPDR